jgi:hypothetical protein
MPTPTTVYKDKGVFFHGTKTVDLLSVDCFSSSTLAKEKRELRE